MTNRASNKTPYISKIKSGTFTFSYGRLAGSWAMNKGITRAITLSVVGILPLAPFCRPIPDGTVRAAGPDQTNPAPPSKPFKVAVYDADPEHLWNRLYAALYVRTADD